MMMAASRKYCVAGFHFKFITTDYCDKTPPSHREQLRLPFIVPIWNGRLESIHHQLFKCVIRSH